MPSTANVMIYSVQVLLVVAAAAAASAALTLPPRARLAYWRGVMLASLLLPLTPGSAPFGSDVVSGSVAGMVAAGGAARDVWLVSLLALVPRLLVAGAVVRAAWLAGGLGRLRQLRRDSVPASIDAEIEALRRQLAPAAALAWHETIAQPVTFGIRRPLILLPRRLLDLPAAARRAVVCHELHHVARRDWGWLMLEEAARTLFWFHPAMRWAIGQAQLSREQHVDDLVVALTADRREYMGALVTLAETPGSPRAAVAFLSRRHLAARIAHLARRTVMSRRQIALRAAALLTMTALAGVTTVTALPLQRGARIYAVSDRGVKMPAVIKEVKPVYTPGATERKIQGTVLLECVVALDGTPQSVRVVRDLYADLDRAAVDALKQWRFKPGTRNGKPVPVRVSVELTFTLK